MPVRARLLHFYNPPVLVYAVQPRRQGERRRRSFSITEVKERDFKLDSFKWLKEESLEDADGLPEPEE